MASAVIMTLFGAVANATAFVGGNAMFHAFDAQNAADERKRNQSGTCSLARNSELKPTTDYSND